MSIKQWSIHKNYRVVFISIVFLFGCSSLLYSSDTHHQGKPQSHHFWARLKNPFSGLFSRKINLYSQQAAQPLTEALNTASAKAASPWKKLAQETNKDFYHYNTVTVNELNKGFDESCKTSLIFLDKILERRFYQATLCGAALLGAHHAISNVDYKTNPKESSKKFWLSSGLAVFSTLGLCKMWYEMKASRNPSGTIVTGPTTKQQDSHPTTGISKENLTQKVPANSNKTSDRQSLFNGRITTTTINQSPPSVQRNNTDQKKSCFTGPIYS